MRLEEAPPGWRRDNLSPAYIVGPRVTLRHVSLGFSRAELLRQYRWGQDEDLQYWSGNIPSSASFAQFEADVTSWAFQRDARRDRFALLDERETLIGMVSYYNVEFERQQAELGIYIGERSCWNRGYGTEAIVSLLGHLFRNTGLQSMLLTTYASNGRAKACYEKVGFETTSTMRKYSGRAGYYVDLTMRISRERFMALNGDVQLTFHFR